MFKKMFSKKKSTVKGGEEGNKSDEEEEQQQQEGEAQNPVQQEQPQETFNWGKQATSP